MKTKFQLQLLLLLWGLTYVCLYSQSHLPAAPYPIVAEGETLLSNGQKEEAVSLAERVLANKNIPPKAQAESLYILGWAYFEQNEFEKSINSLEEAARLAKNLNENILLLKSWAKLGAALSESGAYKKAETVIKNALKLAEEIQNDEYIIKSYIILGAVYYQSEEFEKGLSFNNLAEKKLAQMPGLELEKGINTYDKANNLMELYIKSNKPNLLAEARSYYEKAINIYINLDRKDLESDARNAYAGCLLYYNDTNRAKEETKKSIKLGIDTKNDSALLNGYYTLTSVCEMEGDYEGRLDALKNMLAIMKRSGKEQDVVFIRDQFTNNNIKITEAIIDGQIKSDELKILKKENEHLSERNKLTLILVTFLGFAILGVLWYFRQRQHLMQQTIDNLVKTRDIEFIKAKLQGQEAERQELARQIHDGIGGLLISAKHNLEAALKAIPSSENKLSERISENLRLQENSYKELRKIAYALEQNDAPWWETLQKFCAQLAKDKGIEINFYPYNLDESVTGKLGDEIRFITQELITNAVKHAEATEISLQVSLIENEIDIIVEDNGKEFDPKSIKRGIGMRSIEERVRKLGGRFSFEESEVGGAIAFVDFPLKNRAVTNLSSINAGASQN